MTDSIPNPETTAQWLCPNGCKAPLGVAYGSYDFCTRCGCVHLAPRVDSTVAGTNFLCWNARP